MENGNEPEFENSRLPGSNQTQKKNCEEGTLLGQLALPLLFHHWIGQIHFHALNTCVCPLTSLFKFVILFWFVFVFLVFFLLCFLLHYAAYGILVPQPRIEPSGSSESWLLDYQGIPLWFNSCMILWLQASRGWRSWFWFACFFLTNHSILSIYLNYIINIW